ncbi:MAG: YgiQ family radical SAM protein [Myxococcales bacterium]|nr:YgiQ family radical SAM protein [Myxococcales bacterium]
MLLQLTKKARGQARVSLPILPRECHEPRGADDVSFESDVSSGTRPFLPTTLPEAKAMGWDELDIVIITGDAYVDHPAFGPVLIARVLAGRGFRVGILAQPDWRNVEDFRRLGRPRLFFGVSAGNLDSMLNRLTAQKKNRSEDAYTPGGRLGARPDRATIVYANRCREAYPEVPIVLGGIEASLRRIAHYDYWSDAVRRPILVDAKADLLVYGMGERPVCEIADRLRSGEPISRIRDVRGTAYVLSQAESETACARSSRFVTDGLPVALPSYEEVSEKTQAAFQRYAEMARQVHLETNPHNGRPLIQRVGNRAVYFNPPALPLETADLDTLYDLPFARALHPSYREPVPAFETVKHSLVLMRGCFGGCTFCSIAEHEGRFVQSRSADSVLRELRALRRMDDFRGVVSDLGGPTANMYRMRCADEALEVACRRSSCMHPTICSHLQTDHQPLIDLLRRIRHEPGIRKALVTSGVRYDLAERSPEYIRELAQHHVGSQLAVAPEHVSGHVLRLMKKPNDGSYDRFAEQFACAAQQAGREPQLMPSFISGHPGSRLEDMIEVALYLKRHALRPRHVQDFVPTPMSLATTMYYTGLNPLSMGAAEPVYVARGLREKKLQRALLLYWDPGQQDLVREALLRAGRPELIGYGPDCLVPPAAPSHRPRQASDKPLFARRVASPQVHRASSSRSLDEHVPADRRGMSWAR